MIELIYFAIFYVLCCFIVIWRLIKAMYSGRGIYLDIAIVTAILGFLSQVLIGKYLEGTL